MDLPNEQSLRWLVRRYASLLARDGRAENKRKLVLPTAEFFPDEFEGDAGSVNLLFWRLQEHASLTDLDVELRFVDDGTGEAAGGGGCSTGSCSTSSCGPSGAKDKTLSPITALVDGGFRVDVRLSDAKTPVTLTAALATSLAHLFVLETGGFDGWPEAEARATCEVAAVMLGFGVLLSNASYMYSKSCGGARVESATALDVSELAVALAVFSAVHDKTARLASSLGVTQRDAYGEARTWIESNTKLVRRLKTDPGAVAADEHLAVQQARPWLARLLGLGAGKKKQKEVFDEDGLADFEKHVHARVARTNSPKNAEVDAKLIKIRALVDESLQDLRSSRE